MAAFPKKKFSEEIHVLSSVFIAWGVSEVFQGYQYLQDQYCYLAKWLAKHGQILSAIIRLFVYWSISAPILLIKQMDRQDQEQLTPNFPTSVIGFISHNFPLKRKLTSLDKPGALWKEPNGFAPSVLGRTPHLLWVPTPDKGNTHPLLPTSLSTPENYKNTSGECCSA